ncbi:MAG: hypothetical protein EZS28_009785 [Streblomastix strix]|uniref:C2H2-type domain-containing protein n=1 Tax=Streblomastix strix TaxID=222440 RepID=A0A5J4WJJ7_9EUKA|nr:MAG: hypothetical protein EZS28_009785 [Streblomastix strix]
MKDKELKLLKQNQQKERKSPKDSSRSGITPFNCSLCPKIFESEDYLRLHMDKRHGKEIEEGKKNDKVSQKSSATISDRNNNLAREIFEPSVHSNNSYNVDERQSRLDIIQKENEKLKRFVEEKENNRESERKQDTRGLSERQQQQQQQRESERRQDQYKDNEKQYQRDSERKQSPENKQVKFGMDGKQNKEDGEMKNDESILNPEFSETKKLIDQFGESRISEFGKTNNEINQNIQPLHFNPRRISPSVRSQKQSHSPKYELNKIQEQDENEDKLQRTISSLKAEFVDQNKENKELLTQLLEKIKNIEKEKEQEFRKHYRDEDDYHQKKDRNDRNERLEKYKERYYEEERRRKPPKLEKYQRDDQYDYNQDRNIRDKSPYKRRSISADNGNDERKISKYEDFEEEEIIIRKTYGKNTIDNIFRPPNIESLLSQISTSPHFNDEQNQNMKNESMQQRNTIGDIITMDMLEVENELLQSRSKINNKNLRDVQQTKERPLESTSKSDKQTSPKLKLKTDNKKQKLQNEEDDEIERSSDETENPIDSEKHYEKVVEPNYDDEKENNPVKRNENIKLASSTRNQINYDEYDKHPIIHDFNSLNLTTSLIPIYKDQYKHEQSPERHQKYSPTNNNTSLNQFSQKTHNLAQLPKNDEQLNSEDIFRGIKFQLSEDRDISTIGESDQKRKRLEDKKQDKQLQSDSILKKEQLLNDKQIMEDQQQRELDRIEQENRLKLRQQREKEYLERERKRDIEIERLKAERDKEFKFHSTSPVKGSPLGKYQYTNRSKLNDDEQASPESDSFRNDSTITPSTSQQRQQIRSHSNPPMIQPSHSNAPVILPSKLNYNITSSGILHVLSAPKTPHFPSDPITSQQYSQSGITPYSISNSSQSSSLKLSQSQISNHQSSSSSSSQGNNQQKASLIPLPVMAVRPNSPLIYKTSPVPEQRVSFNIGNDQRNTLQQFQQNNQGDNLPRSAHSPFQATELVPSQHVRIVDFPFQSTSDQQSQPQTRQYRSNFEDYYENPDDQPDNTSTIPLSTLSNTSHITQRGDFAGKKYL